MLAIQSFLAGNSGCLLLFFSFTSYNCFVSMGFLPWEIWGAFRGESHLQSHYSIYGVCWVFWCCHNPPNFDKDYRIFNVRPDVNACDCTLECTDTERESALEVDSGRKIPCHTRQSSLSHWRAGLTLYQLSYVPIHEYYWVKATAATRAVLQSLTIVLMCFLFTYHDA